MADDSNNTKTPNQPTPIKNIVISATTATAIMFVVIAIVNQKANMTNDIKNNRAAIVRNEKRDDKQDERSEETLQTVRRIEKALWKVQAKLNIVDEAIPVEFTTVNAMATCEKLN